VSWLLLALAAGCAGPPGAGADPDVWDWGLPEHFSEPEVPADNPMSAEKVSLGRLLFYDFQISVDGGRSCGICHEPAKGFTDGFVKAVGTTGDIHPRNTLSVANVAWRAALTWRDPAVLSLEAQLLSPLMGTEPIVEMGMGGEEALLLERLSDFAPYPELFEAVWPEEPAPISLDNAARAIAAYERTLITADSPYDRYLLGEEGALSEAALRGMGLFFGERLGCGACHSGLFLDRPLGDDGQLADAPGYFNTGLYNLDGEGAYPPDDPGLAAITGDPSDTGAFRTPSLRNVAVTGSWSHDGTVASLEDAVDNYARGGRLLEGVAYAGDGATSPYKSPLIAGFAISDDERADVVAFLEALTDWEALSDPRYADPFCRDDSGDPTDCLEPLSFD